MLIVQTSNGLDNANSYASTADLSAYALERGVVLISDNLESLLIKATDYIDSKQYKGEPFNNTQSTKFPIKGVGVPLDIKKATMQLAIMYDSLPATPVTPVAQTKKEVVDVIEVEYFEAKSTESPILTLVNDLLRPYLAGLSVGVNFSVRRG